MMNTTVDTKELVRTALTARALAYTPYSHFSVGAALLTESGKVYTGCNIECASYSASNCAERTAFFKAVSNGERKFTAIAIVGGKSGAPVTSICPPCGICRQVMMEFCDPKTFQVVLASGNETWKVLKLDELMPMGFGPKNLK